MKNEKIGPRVKIGLVGLGKIAIDQHIPAIRANPNWELVAGCSPNGRPEGILAYPTLAAMLEAHPDIEAVSICTPPKIRQQIAHEAIAAGKHVFLEKPAAATLSEAEAIRAQAEARGVTVLAAWHSRFAPGVEAARAWIAENRPQNIHIVWKENVRQWHPGQKWIFAPGGMGVFDPGINSLSILTRLIDDAVFVRDAHFHVPVNCQAPIKVQMAMDTDRGVSIKADYDFLQEHDQTWSIFAETAGGARLALHEGGARLEIEGKVVVEQPEAEYPGLYAHFYDLIQAGKSDADLAPLRIVADAFMIQKLSPAPAYIE
jgi:predicted dehydrogenase